MFQENCDLSLDILPSDIIRKIIRENPEETNNIRLVIIIFEIYIDCALRFHKNGTRSFSSFGGTIKRACPASTNLRSTVRKCVWVFNSGIYTTSALHRWRNIEDSTRWAMTIVQVYPI